MNLYYHIAAVFILLFKSCVAFTQHVERENELVHLTVVNKELNIILDSIVNAEKRCEYYNENLLFSFSTQKVGNNYSITIASLMDSNLVQYLGPYGYFNYAGHLIIVDGDTNETIFSKTDEKKKFKYIKYDPNYHVEGKEKVIHYFNDDSFSQWNFWYIGDKFKFNSKASSCP